MAADFRSDVDNVARKTFPEVATTDLAIQQDPSAKKWRDVANLMRIIRKKYEPGSRAQLMNDAIEDGERILTLARLNLKPVSKREEWIQVFKSVQVRLENVNGLEKDSSHEMENLLQLINDEVRKLGGEGESASKVSGTMFLWFYFSQLTSFFIQTRKRH